MIKNYPLFLPNVIKTFTNSSNVLTDNNIRLKEARRALFYTIEKGYFNKIIIVDGSNQAMLSEEEITQLLKSGIIIEQLLFQQDVNMVKQFGKSQGEMQITNYMINNSVLAKEAGGFIKISPRYLFDNIDDIMPAIYNKENVFYFYHPPIIRTMKTFVCTIFYKTSLDFYKKNIEKGIRDCNLGVSGYLESIFYQRLNGIKKTSICINFPHFSGIAGTTGKSISNRFFKLRNGLSKMGLLCYSFD